MEYSEIGKKVKEIQKELESLDCGFIVVAINKTTPIEIGQFLSWAYNAPPQSLVATMFAAAENDQKLKAFLKLICSCGNKVYGPQQPRKPNSRPKYEA